MLWPQKLEEVSRLTLIINGEIDILIKNYKKYPRKELGALITVIKTLKRVNIKNETKRFNFIL